MVNPPIYVLCIKQFWASVLVKKTNDVVKLEALIHRKKVVVTEDTIRQDLRLDVADDVECLPNDEIFAELACMGCEKPPPKLTFYKAFSLFNERVKTPLFDTMLVQPQADAENEDENKVPTAPTSPSPTHEPLPPPKAQPPKSPSPTHEPLPPPQAYPATSPSPPQPRPALPSSTP
uniref:Xylulose kinase-1 n=1 Tax=Tanacetum cinerariifolium TaxID=118510 RepID=A0A6L2JLF3_TANCI|nr:hypothetical protein [Tanacetum cinerariifolium]